MTSLDPTPVDLSPLERCTAYLHAVAANADFTPHLDPEMIFEELPNRVTPKGARSDIAAMRLGAERGQKILRSQHYEVLGGFEGGASNDPDAPTRVVLEVTWTGVLSVAYGSLAPGDAMRARCAMIFELRAGRILRQRNYDCYDPF